MQSVGRRLKTKDQHQLTVLCHLFRDEVCHDGSSAQPEAFRLGSQPLDWVRSISG
jgi:hypothetical protein